MKRTISYLILLMYLTAPSLIQAQECGNDIIICRDGNSYIEINHPDDSLSLLFISGSDEDSIKVICKDSLIIFDGTMLSYSGAYYLSSDTTICFGQFRKSYCRDVVYPLQSNQCGFFWNTSLCQDPVIYDPFIFCQGDSVEFVIRSSTYNNLNSNYPFHPDRLELQYGEIYDHSDDSLWIEWTESGEFCMLLETVTFIDSIPLYTQHPTVVLPNESIPILANGSAVDSIEICEGDSLYLGVDYHGIGYMEWNSSDGRKHYSPNFTTVFDKPGEYIITFELNRHCNCTPPSQINVTVVPTARPSISCTRTVCLGEEVIYRADNVCDEYIWSIPEEGTIIEGGSIVDDYVLVRWESGTTNTISLSTPDCLDEICIRPNTTQINIINPSVPLIGASDVCTGETEKYTAPNYTGTAFNWSVPDQGTIIGGQGTNTVEVLWKSDIYVTATLTVEYENCNIDCKGYAELEVVIRPKFNILDNVKDVCIDYPFTYRNSLHLPMKWLIIDSNSDTLTTTNNEDIEFTFTQAGNYNIFAIDTTHTTCIDTQSLLINVKSTLSPPYQISGPKGICINDLVQYQVGGLSDEEIIEWKISDGDTLTAVDTIYATA